MIGKLPGPPRAMRARAVGVVCIAVGFVMGVEGLGNSEDLWLRSALALIVTGLVAQIYALVTTLRNLKHDGPRTEAYGENEVDHRDTERKE